MGHPGFGHRGTGKEDAVNWYLEPERWLLCPHGILGYSEEERLLCAGYRRQHGLRKEEKITQNPTVCSTSHPTSMAADGAVVVVEFMPWGDTVLDHFLHCRAQWGGERGTMDSKVSGNFPELLLHRGPGVGGLL